jgi:hypothetical protein
MKKLLMVLVLVFAVFALTGCWPGEVGVETVFTSKDGAGTRTIILDVMDDTLSTTAITNPDDPEGTEGKGAVINSTHIQGGVSAIQTWLEANAPTFVTVSAMKTEGYHRYFTLTYSFTDFADFLAKYEQLVNLSPTLSWSDFDATEKPTWVCEGRTCTFKESKDIVEASLDWAIDGIWTDIYLEADLAGFVTKADISVLANYSVSMGEALFEELQRFDPTAADGAGTGKMVYVTSSTLQLTGEFPTSPLLIGGIIAGAVVIIGGAVFFFLKKKPA